MQPPKGSQPQGPNKTTVPDDTDSVLADFDDSADAGFDGPGPYQEKLLDADFFNQFPDDFDELDMEIEVQSRSQVDNVASL